MPRSPLTRNRAAPYPPAGEGWGQVTSAESVPGDTQNEGRSFPLGAVLAGGLSLALPGLGQLVRRRFVEAFLFLLGTLIPYFFFLALATARLSAMEHFAASGGVTPAFRPPPEHWALLLLGVAFHLLSVWDATRRARR